MRSVRTRHRKPSCLTGACIARTAIRYTGTAEIFEHCDGSFLFDGKAAVSRLQVVLGGQFGCNARLNALKRQIDRLPQPPLYLHRERSTRDWLARRAEATWAKGPHSFQSADRGGRVACLYATPRTARPDVRIRGRISRTTLGASAITSSHATDGATAISIAHRCCVSSPGDRAG